MNINFWKLYKESDVGKKMIQLFDPENTNVFEGAQAIVDYTQKLIGDASIEICPIIDLYYANIPTFQYFPKQDKEWTRELFAKFVEEYELKDFLVDENQNIEILGGKENLVLPKDKYRIKAAQVLPLSLTLYYSFEYFKPMLLPTRFDIIQKTVMHLV